MLNRDDERGSAMIEVVIALAVLGIVLMSVFMFYSIVVRGNAAIRQNSSESMAIHSMRDELKSAFETDPVRNLTDAEKAIDRISRNYPMFEVEVSENGKGLYTILARGMEEGESDQNVYTIKIYESK